MSIEQLHTEAPILPFVGERSLALRNAALLRYPLTVLSKRLELMAIIRVRVAKYSSERFVAMRIQRETSADMPHLIVARGITGRDISQRLKQVDTSDPWQVINPWLMNGTGELLTPGFYSSVSLGDDGPFKLTKGAIGSPVRTPATLGINYAAEVEIESFAVNGCKVQANWSDAFKPPDTLWQDL